MKMEQIAIAASSIEQADEIVKNLSSIGFDEWVEDTVIAEGSVFGVKGKNQARLQFNYQMGFEFEILTYLNGPSWHDKRIQDTAFPFQSHIGKHATAKEIIYMKEKMAELGCGIAQEVYTSSHTNPNIKGKRRYHYVIFDSKDKIGFDLKLIERIMIEK